MFQKYMKASLKLLCLSFVAAPVGCSICSTRGAIPAYRLPQQFEAPSHQSLQAINFALLEKDQNVEYRLGPGDIVGVLVQGIVPPGATTVPSVIQSQPTLNGVYYPPTGVLNGPAIGLPANVTAEGRLPLPLVEPVKVAGLTLVEATEAVSRAYISEQLLKEGRDRVSLTILKPRVNRIVVLREDSSNETANAIPRNTSVVSRRGTGFAVDLPDSESDVLHSLIATGGLPGIDAYNEVWILRQSTMPPQAVQQAKFLADAGETPENIVAQLASGESAQQQIVRIPLKVCPGEPLPFTADDIVLNDGDVVYICPRRNEYFYTGGLLPGAQIPFPRDEDLDVMEAIALANGSIGGIGGGPYRTSAGPNAGNIVPPRRVLILRKLPNGDQLPIRVDLANATKNPAERIRIMPGDFIMMYYTPGEQAANIALNLLNFNFLIQ